MRGTPASYAIELVNNDPCTDVGPGARLAGRTSPCAIFEDTPLRGGRRHYHVLGDPVAGRRSQSGTERGRPVWWAVQQPVFGSCGGTSSTARPSSTRLELFGVSVLRNLIINGLIVTGTSFEFGERRDD